MNCALNNDFWFQQLGENIKEEILRKFGDVVTQFSE